MAKTKFKMGEAIVFDPAWKVEDYPTSDLKRGEVVYFLTEIPNAPGHCIIITSDKNKVQAMRHTDDFRSAKEDEF